MSQENTEKLEQLINDVDELIAYKENRAPHRFKSEQLINHIGVLLKDIEEQISYRSSPVASQEEISVGKKFLEIHELVGDILRQEKFQQTMKDIGELLASHQNEMPEGLAGEQYINHIKVLLKDVEAQISSWPSDKTTPDEIATKKEYLVQIREIVDDIEETILLKATLEGDLKVADKRIKELSVPEVPATFPKEVMTEPHSVIDKGNLSTEEKEYLKNYVSQIEAGEMAQVQDLIDNCSITFQFAKTHSVYLKDWEKTKERMENNLKNGILPPGVSANLHRAIIDTTDEIMQKKLKMVKDAFEVKFGESIFNYLGPDGKTKWLFEIFD